MHCASVPELSDIGMPNVQAGGVHPDSDAGNLFLRDVPPDVPAEGPCRCRHDL